MEQNARAKREPKPIINLRLPDDALAALKVQAEKELGSVSQIVRRAIAEYLERLSAAA